MATLGEEVNVWGFSALSRVSAALLWALALAIMVDLIVQDAGQGVGTMATALSGTALVIGVGVFAMRYLASKVMLTPDEVRYRNATGTWHSMPLTDVVSFNVTKDGLIIHKRDGRWERACALKDGGWLWDRTEEAYALDKALLAARKAAGPVAGPDD